MDIQEKYNELFNVEEDWGTLRNVPSSWLNFIKKSDKELLIGKNSSLLSIGTVDKLSKVTTIARRLETDKDSDTIGCYLSIDDVPTLLVTYTKGEGFKITYSTDNNGYPIGKGFLKAKELQALITRIAQDEEGNNWTPKKGRTLRVWMIGKDHTRASMRKERKGKIDSKIISELNNTGKVSIGLVSSTKEDMIELKRRFEEFEEQLYYVSSVDDIEYEDVTRLSNMLFNVNKQQRLISSALSDLRIKVKELKDISKDLI